MSNGENRKTSKLKIAAVAAVFLLVLAVVWFIYPILAHFMLITVLAATVIGFFVLKFFERFEKDNYEDDDDEFEDDEEEAEEEGLQINLFPSAAAVQPGCCQNRRLRSCLFYQPLRWP